MEFKDRFYNAISALLPNNKVFAEYYRRGGGGSGSSDRAQWKRQTNMLQAKEIKDWKNGVMAATDPENPRRGDLMRFYQTLMLDNHLASVIDTRILRVQRSSFKLLNDKDEENYELKALLERPWFEDLVRLVLSSRFQGATLIEMFDVDAETLEPDPQKKNPDATVGARFIAPNAQTDTQTTPPTAATWDVAVEQLVNQIWSGNASASDLNRDLVLKYYSGLNKATKNGWGAGYYTDELTRNFRENLLKFSGAKSYNLITQIQELKLDGVEKSLFVEQAKKLVNLHNETWQWTEEKFASNSASAARDFQGYQKDADLYPNLKYRTMGDAEVRPEHAANEGVIKPINKWTKIPPLDYGCRCWLEQTFESPNNRDVSVYNDSIANNPAIDGELFTKKNGYFQQIPKEDIRKNVR